MRSRNERRLFFPQFLDALAAIATRRYPGVPVPQALRTLLTHHVVPLLDSISMTGHLPGPPSPQGANGARPRSPESTGPRNRALEVHRSQAAGEIDRATTSSTSTSITNSPSPVAPPADVRSDVAPSSHCDLARYLDPITASSPQVVAAAPPAELHRSITCEAANQQSLHEALERARSADAEVMCLQASLDESLRQHKLEITKMTDMLRSVAIEGDARLARAQAAATAEIDDLRAQLASASTLQAELRVQLGQATVKLLAQERDHEEALAILKADHTCSLDTIACQAADLATLKAECTAAAIAAQSSEKRALTAEMRATELATSLQTLLVDSMQSTAENKGAWDNAMASFSAKLSEAEFLRTVAEERAATLERSYAEAIAKAVESAIAELRDDLAKTSNSYLDAESRASQASLQLSALENRHAAVVLKLRNDLAVLERNASDAAEKLVRFEDQEHLVAKLTAQLELVKQNEKVLQSEAVQLKEMHENAAQAFAGKLGAAALREDALSLELVQCQAELLDVVRENQSLAETDRAAKTELQRLAKRVAEVEALLAGHEGRASNFESELEALHLASIAARAETASSTAEESAQLSARLEAAEMSRINALGRSCELEKESQSLRDEVTRLGLDLTNAHESVAEGRLRIQALEEKLLERESERERQSEADSARILSLKELLHESTDSLLNAQRPVMSVSPGCDDSSSDDELGRTSAHLAKSRSSSESSDDVLHSNATPRRLDITFSSATRFII